MSVGVPRAVLLLLGLIMLGMCVQVAMLAPPLSGNDEKAHYSYAVSLYEGTLPDIDTPMPDEPDRFPLLSRAIAHQPDDAHREIWVANHPPLYYVASVPLIAVADAVSSPGGGQFAMRLLDALGMATGIALTGALALELVPRRPIVAVLAPLLVLSCVTVAYDGGFILNDGPAFAASTLTLLLAVRLLRRGPEPVLLAGAAAAGAAAAALRAPGVVAVAVCALGALLGALRRPGDPRRVVRGLGAAVLVGAVPAAVIGWFYVGNLRRYGDIGATDALVRKFHRAPRGSFLDALTDGQFYTAQFRGQWLRLPGMTDGRLLVIPLVVGGLALLGLLVAAGAALRRRDDAPAGGATVLAWLLAVGFTVAIEASVLTFFTAGGSDHGRYLIPVLPVLATVTAAGLLGLGELVPVGEVIRRDALIAVFTAVPMLTMGAILHLRSDHLIVAGGYLPDLDMPMIPGAGNWAALGVAGIGAVLVLLWLLRQALLGERLPSGHA